MELSKIKNIKIPYLVTALVLGVFLVILSGIVPREKGRERAEETAAAPFGEEECRRLEKLIGDIDGVSDVSVFITYENNGIKDVYCVSEKNSSQGDNANSAQTRTEPVTSRDGSLETPFVREEIMPQVRGVIISARGIRNPALKASLTEAVASVFGVSVHRVRILHKD